MKMFLEHTFSAREWLSVEGCGAFSRATTPAADCMTLINYALECARTAMSVHLNEDIFVG